MGYLEGFLNLIGWTSVPHSGHTDFLVAEPTGQQSLQRSFKQRGHHHTVNPESPPMILPQIRQKPGASLPLLALLLRFFLSLLLAHVGHLRRLVILRSRSPFRANRDYVAPLLLQRSIPILPNLHLRRRVPLPILPLLQSQLFPPVFRLNSLGIRAS